MKLKFAKPKKVKLTTLRNKADAVFSKWQRSNYPKCEIQNSMYCKHGGSLQCAHIETRSNRNLRYDINNVLTLCMAHHRYFHHHPLDFIEYLQLYQTEQYEHVMLERHKMKKMTADDYRKIIKEFDIV